MPHCVWEQVAVILVVFAPKRSTPNRISLTQSLQDVKELDEAVHQSMEKVRTGDSAEWWILRLGFVTLPRDGSRCGIAIVQCGVQAFKAAKKVVEKHNDIIGKMDDANIT